MKIYIASNAQPDLSDNSHISNSGKEQAKYLGMYISHLGFKGNIYSVGGFLVSETAKIIADITGATIVLCENDFDKIKNIEFNEDVMFVGDNDAVIKMTEFFGISGKKREVSNCSFSMIDTDGIMDNRYLDNAHLPYKLRTFNDISQYEIDKKRTQDIIENHLNIPDKLVKSKETKILHIGDTGSYSYPYYKELIDKTKPDIIIHTGDFVDEVKAGRMINTENEYEEGVKNLADIILSSTASEVYIVRGNNDVESVIRKHFPLAKILEPNTTIDLCGISCTFGHSHFEAENPAQWYFYGHGFTGENWSEEMNDIKNGVCKFNAARNPSVIIMPERERFLFPSLEV